RHTRFSRDWSSDVCSSDLTGTQFRHPVTNGRGRPPRRPLESVPLDAPVPRRRRGMPMLKRCVMVAALALGGTAVAQEPVDLDMEIGRASCRESGGVAAGGG